MKNMKTVLLEQTKETPKTVRLLIGYDIIPEHLQKRVRSENHSLW